VILVPIVIFIVVYRYLRGIEKMTGRKFGSSGSYRDKNVPDDDEINSVEFFDIDE